VSPSEPLPPLVALVGPTAVGKTGLALRLAECLPVEVVSADSRQIYRGLNIGTAKATLAERKRVRHHLIDIVEPDEPLTLAQYQELAYAAIDNVHHRDHIPLLVGGTGLYVRAVLEGLQIPKVAPDPELRAELHALAEAEGIQVLHRRLARLDPEAAAHIDPRNVRRVVRALEVCRELDQPISDAQASKPPDYRILRIGLTLPRRLLFARIDARVDRMLEAGLVDEVRTLMEHGYSFHLPAMSGLGYRQIGQYLKGDIDLQEAVALIKRHTRRFVRQQANWFRADDPRIMWFDVSGAYFDSLLAQLRAFLKSSQPESASVSTQSGRHWSG